MNKHNSMIIPDRICQNNKKLFVAVNPVNPCKLKFSGHFVLMYWLALVSRLLACARVTTGDVGLFTLLIV